MEDLLSLAEGCGFDAVARLDMSTLKFMPEVRAMCRPDQCRSYNKSWCCPPAVPDLETLAARCRQYDTGILLQTIGQREDSFDFEIIEDTRERLNAAFVKFHEKVKDIYPNHWPMGLDHYGLGACTSCESCTWPDAPCRHPDKIFPSMSSCGLLVSQICLDNGLSYNYGPLGISFTACYLIKT